jgi:hypothetical protein
LIAFLVFILGYAYSYVQAIGYKTSIDLRTNSTEVDPDVPYSVGWFFSNFWAYIAAPFFLIVLGLWLVVYSQKKGGQVYDEV